MVGSLVLVVGIILFVNREASPDGPSPQNSVRITRPVASWYPMMHHMNLYERSNRRTIRGQTTAPLSRADVFPKRKAAEDGLPTKGAILALITTSKRTPGALDATIDGLAVLHQSIEEAFNGKDTAVGPVTTNIQLASKWQLPVDELDFIVLLTSDIPSVHHSVIESIGWKVIVKDSPLQPSDIRNSRIAHEVVTDGAMGINEMVKMEAFRMREYRTIVMVDCDVLFHKPFPELFQLKTALGWTHGGWESEKINGGFLVVNPHASSGSERIPPRDVLAPDSKNFSTAGLTVGDRHFHAVLDILREGDFRPGSAWRGSGIGWTYGGRTIQGLLPYYFFSVLARTADTEIPRCKYNNMVQLQKCKVYPIENITSNHFTGDCTKPWWCGPSGHPMCTEFRDRWWKVMGRVGSRFQVKPGHCAQGKYHALSPLLSGK